VSLALIRRAAPAPSAAIIDVGGGASTLVDSLLAAGYRRISVLDVSPTALAEARRRLAPGAALVNWIDADVLAADLPGAVDGQVDTLVSNGVPAALCNSSLAGDEKVAVAAGLRQGRYGPPSAPSASRAADRQGRRRAQGRRPRRDLPQRDSRARVDSGAGGYFRAGSATGDSSSSATPA
jgi:hypothetical protein